MPHSAKTTIPAHAIFFYNSLGIISFFITNRKRLSNLRLPLYAFGPTKCDGRDWSSVRLELCVVWTCPVTVF